MLSKSAEIFENYRFSEKLNSKFIRLNFFKTAYSLHLNFKLVLKKSDAVVPNVGMCPTGGVKQNFAGHEDLKHYKPIL